MPATAAVGGRGSSRASGELAVDRGQRALRGGGIRFDVLQLGARGIHALLDRAGAGQRPHELLVERLLLLLGVLQLGAALGELLIHEDERALRLRRAARGAAGDELVDQPVGDRLREMRILRIGETAAGEVDADLVEIVLRALDRDRVLQPRSPSAPCRAGRGLAGEVGALDHRGERVARGQRLANQSMSCACSLGLMPTACGRIDCGWM